MVNKYGYKDDSTKGKALVRPMSYKGDVLVQVWIDSRVLATLSKWIDDNIRRTRFMSEVVKDSLDILVEHLIDTGETKLVEDTVIARDTLEVKYRVNLNSGDRGMRNAQHNKILSERRKLSGEIKKPYGADGSVNGVEQPDGESEAEVKKRIRIQLEELEKAKIDKDADESMDRYKREFKHDKDGVVIVPKREAQVEDSEVVEDIVEEFHNPTMNEIEAEDKKLAAMDLSSAISEMSKDN